MGPGRGGGQREMWSGNGPQIRHLSVGSTRARKATAWRSRQSWGLPSVLALLRDWASKPRRGGVRRLRLTGSAARGKAGPESDTAQCEGPLPVPDKMFWSVMPAFGAVVGATLALFSSTLHSFYSNAIRNRVPVALAAGRGRHPRALQVRDDRLRRGHAFGHLLLGKVGTCADERVRQSEPLRQCVMFLHVGRVLAPLDECCPDRKESLVIALLPACAVKPRADQEACNGRSRSAIGTPVTSA